MPPPCEDARSGISRREAPGFPLARWWGVVQSRRVVQKRAMKDEPPWTELCQQAASEQDHGKLMELIDEITRHLDEKDGRLRPAPRSQPGAKKPVARSELVSSNTNAWRGNRNTTDRTEGLPTTPCATIGTNGHSTIRALGNSTIVTARPYVAVACFGFDLAVGTQFAG